MLESILSLIAGLVPVLVSTVGTTKIVKAIVEGGLNLVGRGLGRLPTLATTGIAVVSGTIFLAATGATSSEAMTLLGGLVSGLLSAGLVAIVNRFGGKPANPGTQG